MTSSLTEMLYHVIQFLDYVHVMAGTTLKIIWNYEQLPSLPQNLEYFKEITIFIQHNLLLSSALA